MPPETGEGVRDGVVEGGRVHPVLVPAEDDGNFASLASTRREWDVAGGGGDLTKSFHSYGQNRQGLRTVPNVPVVLAILEDTDDEGI
jgi:hypothetical protein